MTAVCNEVAALVALNIGAQSYGVIERVLRLHRGKGDVCSASHLTAAQARVSTPPCLRMRETAMLGGSVGAVPAAGRR